MIFKKYILFTFILFSCTPKTPIVSVPNMEDTVKIDFIRKLFADFQKLDSIDTRDSTLIAENKKLKENISNIINYALNGKEFQIKSIYFQQKLSSTKEQIKYIEDKAIELNKKYESTIRENETYKHKLSDEFEKRNNILKDKAKLEQDLSEASRLLIIGVNIKGIGTSFGLFSKPKEIETNKAGKIKKIKVEFIFPVNQFAVKEVKNISIILKSTNRKNDVKKDTAINYMGIEAKVSLTLQPKMDFNDGDHLINIMINEKLQVEKSFKIIK